MFARVDEQGYRHVIMDEIIDLRTDGTQCIQDDSFDTLISGAKRSKETTKVWHVPVQCKYGRTTWNYIKDVKESYPVQLTEYAIDNCYSDEPDFAWWFKLVMKRRNRILSNVKSKYWERTHKYGIRVPKYFREDK